MKKKKQRIPIISPHFDEHIEIGGLDLTEGIFTFKDSNGNKVIPKSITIGDSYTKATGKPKILNQIKANTKEINLNPNTNLKSFDWLLVEAVEKPPKTRIIALNIGIIGHEKANQKDTEFHPIRLQTECYDRDKFPGSIAVWNI